MVLHNFIVFEGIDGSGTSTQIALLKNKLPNPGTLFTAEPTSLATGRFLRTLLRGDERLTPGTMAYLFAADRYEHVHAQDGILQTCADGGIVVSDRYFFSSLAYQSAECGRELPAKLNESFPLPEYLFYFDIEPSVSLNRITGRSVTEIYEKREFLEKTAAEYERIIGEYEKTAAGTGMKIIRLDASESVAEVSENIWSILRNMPILNT